MDDLTASASILVDAPASVIFDILADPRQHTRIDGSGSVQEIVDGPERLSEGAQFTVQMKRGLGYRTNNTVVEYEQDALIAWKHRGAHVWRYELTPEAGKVRVTETWDGSGYSGLPRLIFKITGLKGTQRSIEETLVRLKAVAEADAARA
ncbi:SRPBCC family protein [Nocardioides jishulii]|uniref:Dimethyladenosine transferase n=1 Tax=Nocardioides jishulii TaxID=2575440 RepID=A0A4V5TKK5_9ACTN|nr:SRPBCC family protein [Nocardioides jishulii]QCX26158.1 dimethyladenosine transferase [Nocardioides jishulii]TKI64043.1 dimethyladenosine transferase [Nocardioides jishulii]